MTPDAVLPAGIHVLCTNGERDDAGVASEILVTVAPHAFMLCAGRCCRIVVCCDLEATSSVFVIRFMSAVLQVFWKPFLLNDMRLTHYSLPLKKPESW